MVMPRLGDSGVHFGVCDGKRKSERCSLCGRTQVTMFYFDDNEGYAYEFMCRQCLQLAIHEIDKMEIF